ncbi:MAG: ExbD/TolR family protein [Roseovarius sp.]
MFSFAESRPPRKPSLTPMIDVVFLLLVFFMLASRFGHDSHLLLNVAGGETETAYRGPPRLIDVLPDGLRLNGQAVAPDSLLAEIGALTERPEDTIVLRARDGAALQRLVTVMEQLGEGGFRHVVLVE